ncbi:MAG: Ppx/GppA phosphatase family protein [Bacillota bacterium]|nr:Ppx/GppA phosphatase family protein [Bacillota bacterium]
MIKLKKYATIDIGTNSVRLLLCAYDEGEFHDVRKKVEMTRLGKGVNETKMLDTERMLETARVVGEFVEESRNFGVEEIYIMATSAVRDAQNASEFTDMVLTETGIAIDVISGEQEAEIGFAGVLSGIKDESGLNLVIDIGGGSTELIVGNHEGILFSMSLDVGAVRMTGAFLNHDPVDQAEFERMSRAIDDITASVYETLWTFGVSKAIGIGGTAASFATMLKKMEVYDREDIHGTIVTIENIREINNRLMRMTNVERKEIIGLEEKRADIIFAGGIILEKILSSLKLESFEFSDFDNLEGYLVHSLSKK